MPNRDCFAFKHEGCSALSERVCNWGTCAFYKTDEEVHSERMGAELRIIRLPKEQREYIQRVYRKVKP